MLSLAAMCAHPWVGAMQFIRRMNNVVVSSWAQSQEAIHVSCKGPQCGLVIGNEPLANSQDGGPIGPLELR